MSIDENRKVEIHKIFRNQKANRNNIAKTSAKERKLKLKLLLESVLDSQDKICDAVYTDLRKSREETKLTEIFAVTTELKHAIRKVGKWTKPIRVRTPLAFFGSRNKVIYESIGQSLIIAPWNYPFQLAIGPLVSAITAGNTVTIKPSEKSSATSKLLEEMISNIFDQEEIAVVLGEAEVSKELTSLPFNHIYFTGSPQTGKLVMEAASKHLTKVTLELGGKSPTIVNKDANIKISAQRIAWGKFMNAGQTCVAPDYLFVHKSIKEKFVKELIEAIQHYYGADNEIKRENNYCRIINDSHLNSIEELLTDSKRDGANIIYGGEVNREDNFVSPTLIDNVSLDSQVMTQEIFGPVLPIITYEEESEIFEIVERNPNPLALYVFSKDSSFVKRVIKNIPAGSSAINDVVIHFANYNLPFGGINNSGIGKSHGYYGFKTFSNAKSVMKQSNPSAMFMLYPPYTKFKNKLIDIIIKYL